jgi:hypothetical protein
LTLLLAGSVLVFGGSTLLLPVVPVFAVGPRGGRVLVDRSGRPGRLLPVGVLVAEVGVGVLAVAIGTGRPGTPPPRAVLLGVGFGAVQNDSLVLRFATAGPRRYGGAARACRHDSLCERSHNGLATLCTYACATDDPRSPARPVLRRIHVRRHVER